MDTLDDLAWLRDRARRGIQQASRLRKYTPPGPYTPVEREALAALFEVERAAGRLLAKGSNTPVRPGDHPVLGDRAAV